MTAKRVLLIGGTGVFGERLARHLSGFSELDLIVTSRSESKAKALAQRIRSGNAAASVSGVGLDHQHDLADRLRELNPWAMVDCSGPFQEASYAVASSAVEAGAHAIDLADARDYLLGYSEALESIARDHGVAGLAGASSTPALSSAVVRALTRGWQRIDAIDICITPGGRSEVGRSVISAIMSYAGREIPVWCEGRPASTHGWTGARNVNVPGLGPRRVAPVETVDAELLGKRHAVTSRVEFRAGLESPIEQHGLEVIARLRRAGLIRDPKFLIPSLLAARRLTRLTTSDRGGMLVEVQGLDGNGALRRSRWSLLAERDHGPFVPVLPAAAAIRRLLKGDVEPGAGLASEYLSLSDIEAEMASYAITTETEHVALGECVIAKAVGDKCFDAMPSALKAFHGQEGIPVWRGEADVNSGEGLVARLLRRLFGFPAGGRALPVCVSVERDIEAGVATETWTRNFDGQRFSSVLQCTRNDGLRETFGPFSFTLGITAGPQGIEMPVIAWRFLGIPLPAFLAPRSDAREYQDAEGRFRFDVKLDLPLLGTIAHYRGWLLPA